MRSRTDAALLLDGKLEPKEEPEPDGPEPFAAPTPRADRGARDEEDAGHEERDPDERRPGGAQQKANGARESAAGVATVCAAEGEQHAEDDDCDACLEGAEVDEGAADEHEAAERQERERGTEDGRADGGAEAAGDPASDHPPVPTQVENARKQETECDEAEADELGAVVP